MSNADYAYAMAGASAIVSAIEIVFWIIYTIVMIIDTIALWKLYVKADEPGWAIFVPVYGWWVLTRMACKNNVLWFILLFVPFANFVALIVINIGLAKAFGYGTGMILLMVFLPYVALPIMAFSDAYFDYDLRFGEY